MPTLTSAEPDAYDMDYYYSKYRGRHGLGMNEDTSRLRVLPPDVNPNQCEHLKKRQHYFKVPTQPGISKCLCGQYHTNFTSKYYKLPQTTSLGTTSMETSPIISIQRFNKINDTLPASPITKLAQNKQANPTILFPSYNIKPDPIAITPHSQHVHTCALCKTKNLPCVLSQDNQHSPDYTTAIIFKTRLIHRICTAKIRDIPLRHLPQTKPLSHEQRVFACKIKFVSLDRTEKVKFLKEILSKFPKKNKDKKIQQPKRDSSQDLDWFKLYPITKEIEPNSKLNTQLALQIFDFLKPHLIPFAPGKIIPSENPNIKFTFKIYLTIF